MPRTPRQTKRSPHDGGGGVGGDKSTNSTSVKKSGHRHYTTEEIVDALLAKGGIISAAANLIGCDRDTIYKRRDEPEIAEAIKRGRYYAVDAAEIALQEQVKSKDTTAIIFTLKTQGKDRGYVERVEQTGKDGEPIKQRIEVVYVDTDRND